MLHSTFLNESLASNISTRFCKVRTAPASQHVAPFLPYAIKTTGSRLARHHQNRLETSSTPFTTRGHANILTCHNGLEPKWLMTVKTIRISVVPKSTQEGVRLLLDFFRLDSLRRNCGETLKVGQALNAANSEISKDFLHENIRVICWLKLQVGLPVSLHLCWPRVAQQALRVKALATQQLEIHASCTSLQYTVGWCCADSKRCKGQEIWSRVAAVDNFDLSGLSKATSRVESAKSKQVLDQNVDLSNIDQVPWGSQLYIFEDNEAVIKMIIKWRSPTMRHVSRTHRVEPCLNREFERGEQKSFHTLRIFVFLHGLMKWKVMQRNVERYCELANKTTQQLYKVSTPCIDDHYFKEEEMKSAGELSQVCSQIFLKCLYLARIGRPDILWSVNKLARSSTKWTKACDKCMNRLISYIHHTCEYKQYCHVGNIAKQCRLGLFQDSDLAGNLDDSKSTSGGTLCVLGSHTFVPISWMCKKQTSVSHSSTESEIISLDAGLRLDGFACSGIMGSLETQFRLLIDGGNPLSMVTKNMDQTNDLKEWSTCWIALIVFPQTSNFRIKKLLLYVFEDNEAVIKMIIKGKNSDNETCFQDPQNCAGLVIGQNQPGPKSPNQVCRIQKPNSRDFRKRQFHASWVAQLAASL